MGKSLIAFSMNRISLVIIMLSSLMFANCKDDGCDSCQVEPNYEIPGTYNFNNVDLSGQAQRLSQFFELKSYLALSKTKGVSLDVSRLLAMYENDSANAGWLGTYDPSKQMKNKTIVSQQEFFTQLLKQIAVSSESMEDGSVGQAGVVISNDGISSYLLNANGVEEAQLIEKGLMGAFLYYQIAAVYLGDAKMNVDNTTVIPGSGTEMEHHWDEAFGYYGVPIDFPDNKDNVVFWGSYSNSRNEMTGSNQTLMDAFLKGRAAISNNDIGARNSMIKRIRVEFDKVAASSAIHYLNEAHSNFEDIAVRAHVLSEATGFIYALQFNPDKKYTNEDYMTLISTFAGSKDLASIGFYNTTKASVLSARDQIADWYGLQNLKELL